MPEQIVCCPYCMLAIRAGHCGSDRNGSISERLRWWRRPEQSCERFYSGFRQVNLGPARTRAKTELGPMVSHSNPIQCCPVKYSGGIMGNLTNALQELRAERKQAQLQVDR
jgi:hypothetical protein